jgi:hypothetical protein
MFNGKFADDGAKRVNNPKIYLYNVEGNNKLKFRVFSRTVFPGNYHWEFPALVFPSQPCLQKTTGIENTIMAPD